METGVHKAFFRLLLTARLTTITGGSPRRGNLGWHLDAAAAGHIHMWYQPHPQLVLLEIRGKPHPQPVLLVEIGQDMAYHTH